MKKYFLFTMYAFATMALSSCGGDKVIKGEGSQTTQAPKVDAFSKVQVEMPLKVTITVRRGAKPSVKYSGYFNLINHIKTKVENNILFISDDLENRIAIDSKDVVAEITLPEMTELYLSSNAGADVFGNITGTAFKTTVSGDGKLTIDSINTERFSYSSTGSTSLEIMNGTARLASFSANGDFKIKAFPYQIEEASVSAQGQGACEVTALKNLNTNIGQSCALKYKGHPQMVKNPEGGTVYDAN